MLLAVVLILVIIFSIPVVRDIALKPFIRNSSTFVSGTAGSSDADSASGGGRSSSAASQTPEPGLDRIKADLIGRKIPGWRFDKVSEFVQASITSVARTDTRIDYRLELRMRSFDTKDETLYDAQVFATYLMGDEDWYLDKVEEIFLAYEVKIPPGKSITISGAERCNLQPDSQNRLVWTSQSWDYEISSGPDINDLTLPPAPSYLVKSKSRHTVTVKLKFIPEL